MRWGLGVEGWAGAEMAAEGGGLDERVRALGMDRVRRRCTSSRGCARTTARILLREDLKGDCRVRSLICAMS